MTYKKNAISYGIWALYLMVVGVVLSFMGMAVGGQDTGVPYMALVLLALAFGTLFLIYWIGKKLVDSVKVREKASGRTALRATLIEGILAVLFLVAGILLRVFMIDSAGEEAAYYEVAKVTENGMQVQLVQGSIYYYLCLLNALFRLVGNKWMAGIVLQIALQLAGIVIAYFAVRRLCGRGPALVSLAFLTLAPCSVRDGMTYSPKMLYFCLYALILLIIALYLRRSARPGGMVLTWFLAVLCGALVAFAGYTDIVGFTLALPLCGLPTLTRERRGRLMWVAQFLLCMLTMAGVFCLLVQLDGSMSGSNFIRVLRAWGATYALKGADYDFFFREGGYETILLMVLIALGLFTFMRRKNEEMFSPWIMTVLSITLMRILGIVTPNMNGSYQMYFGMTVLAGVSLSELFVRDGGVAGTSGVPETVAEDLDEAQAASGRTGQPQTEGWLPVEPEAAAAAVAAAQRLPESPREPVPSENAGEPEEREETDVPMWESLTQESAARPREPEESAAGPRAQEEPAAGPKAPEEPAAGPRAQEEPAARPREPEVSAARPKAPEEPAAGQRRPEEHAAEVKEDMIEKKREENPGQVQFIENPLPLPKKHVKKVMDYPIQPDASQMHYDIEVDPQDNFDF